MNFNFETEASGYHKQEHGVRYPRYQAWEFLWEHLHRCGSFNDAGSGKNIETTALHLGFYLANWGMFRGSSKLLNVNLSFFTDFIEYLNANVESEFWDLKLEDFRMRSEMATHKFDNTVSAIKGFEGGSKARISWTPTLITKILLGLWGQCPALDQFYILGFRSFSKQQRLRIGPDCSGRHLNTLAKLAHEERWPLDGFRTQKLNLHYPPGKVLDMAFFNYGLRQ